MKIILLGTGTTLPNRYRNAAGLIVQINEHLNDHFLLFDCGNGILRQIERANLDFMQIRDIFISHIHADHINDLPVLLQANLMLQNSELIKIYGPSTIKKKIEVWLTEIYPSLDVLLNQLEIQEISGGFVIENPNWKVQCIPVRHGTIEAYGFKIIAEKTIVYSGDTGYCEELIQAAHDADVLIHECPHPTSLGSEGHTTPLELGLIAQQANIPKLVLTHFNPDCFGREQEMLSDIRRNFGGKIIFGKDLLNIDLNE